MAYKNQNPPLKAEWEGWEGNTVLESSSCKTYQEVAEAMKGTGADRPWVQQGDHRVDPSAVGAPK